MTRLLYICVIFWAIIDVGYGISTKTDFGEEELVLATNSSKTEDEDVEVKHTIIVSTKLKNNQKGVHISSDGEPGALTYKIGHTDKQKKEDSGEVPVINGYKSIESTLIRTPHTRNKQQVYPDSVLINRNIRNEYDVFPNGDINPVQWKPSNFFNNINWWNQDYGRQNNFRRRIDTPNPGKFHRTITDNGMREFYCSKCKELSNGIGLRGCVQQRSNSWFYETTTPKIKVDGKLAKLN